MNKFFWQAQTSQIYRELQNFKKCGWVTDVTVPQQGKPDKNVFSVTEAGRLELKRWLSDDSMDSNKNPLLMRTFFRGELPVEDNIRFFQAVYWNMTIEYGMMYMDMLRRWSENCITRLEKMEKEHSGD